MKILQVHNHYQRYGGEDAVVEGERALLERHGHQVAQYTKHNDEVDRTPRLELALKTIYNRESGRELLELLGREAPDLIHAHNLFPLISPSLYHAAKTAGIPVVQTLHNFRLLCPSATLFRDGQICESCVGRRIKYPAVVHSCYRGNRAASAVTASMLAFHGTRGAWTRGVHTFIALSQFSKDKFIEGGLKPGKIRVKPNFLPHDPGAGDGAGGYVFFAGRLAKEKGLGVLLDAWARLRCPVPLKIAGDGDLMPWVRERAAGLPGVEVLGHCDHEALLGLLKGAAVCVMPSEWYEAGVPLAIIEAFACGTPVIASDLPSLREAVIEKCTGFRFPIGSADALANSVEEFWALPQCAVAGLRKGARAYYEASFSAGANYPALLKIYEDAIKES
jgi:glycosyltransferase involved in cell wall biosynthesis